MSGVTVRALRIIQTWASLAAGTSNPAFRRQLVCAIWEEAGKLMVAADQERGGEGYGHKA